MGILLEVKELTKYFPVSRTIISGRAKKWVKAVDGIDFYISDSETFGLVGESGCGKTTTAMIMLSLEKPTNGVVLFRGSNIFEMKNPSFKQYRVSVQAIFQDPYGSLDGRKRVSNIIGEPLFVNKVLPRDGINERVEELLHSVGLGIETARLFPHELSGGQRQRVALARSIALNPSLVILDEPVSALDMSISAQILNLLKELQCQLGLAYLLISHDLATVRYMSNRIAVMYLGKIMESGQTENVCAAPLHPYTKALFSSALPFQPSKGREETIISGEVSSAFEVPPGCRFYPRCPFRKPICFEVEPPAKAVNKNQLVACHLY